MPSRVTGEHPRPLDHTGLEHVAGLEPAHQAWKACMQPVTSYVQNGADGIRTRNLRIAKPALSQLELLPLFIQWTKDPQDGIV